MALFKHVPGFLAVLSIVLRGGMRRRSTFVLGLLLLLFLYSSREVRLRSRSEQGFA